MSLFLRNYIFDVITVVSLVCGMMNTQDVDVKELQSSNQESESHTFHPSVPVLSQMDYEILGTNGFSITDITQNSNLTNSVRKELETYKSDQNPIDTKENVPKRQSNLVKSIINRKMNSPNVSMNEDTSSKSDSSTTPQNFTETNTLTQTSPLLELITYFTTYSYSNEQAINHTYENVVTSDESESNTSIDHWTNNSQDENITLSNQNNSSDSPNQSNASQQIEKVTPTLPPVTISEETTSFKTTHEDAGNGTIKEDSEEITENSTLSTTSDFQFTKEEEELIPTTTENVTTSTERTSTVTDANQTPYIWTTELKKTTKADTEVTTPIDVTLSTSAERLQMLVNVTGQIRIIRGMIWMYQLNDKMSAEYQYYSRKVQRMLQEMFWQTWLAKHIKKISVQKFRRGSVMVDFNLLVKTDKHIEAQQMEILFNSYLLPDGGFGGFQMDRHFTKFQIFEPEVREVATRDPEERSIPQWATALIVIAGASLVFVILFGTVTIYGNCTSIFVRNHRRLQEETGGNSFKQNDGKCKDWESKVTAAYENLAADGIYDLDDVGDKNTKA